MVFTLMAQKNLLILFNPLENMAWIAYPKQSFVHDSHSTPNNGNTQNH